MSKQQPLSCQLCGMPITGGYVTYNNELVICEKCNRSVPRCGWCNLPSRQLTSARGMLICPACRNKATTCDFCHQPLLGNYKIYNSTLKVCDQCERTVPRCSRCNIPSRQLIPVRGVMICPACRQEAPLCDCCHIPILSGYVTINGSPQRYCQTCIDTRPRCGVCTAPLNELGKVFSGPEGQTRRCGNCLRTAIMTLKDGEPLYRQVRALLARELSLDVDVLPALTLVGRSHMTKLHAQTGSTIASGTASTTDTTAEPQHLLGFFHRFNERRDIYIEHYLPRALFQGVAAHELAHAWQSAHVQRTQPERIVEGFAEWVAYRILLTLGEREEAEQMTQRNDLYGQGLHYFLDIEGKQGKQAVLKRAME